jgi:hypothetical protein
MPTEFSPASWLVGQYTELRCRNPNRIPSHSRITGARAAARFAPAPVWAIPSSLSRVIEAEIAASP